MRLLAGRSVPVGHTYLGEVWGAFDLPPYFELIGEAEHGAWLLTDRQYAALSSPHLLYTPYALLGHLFAPTGWSPPDVLEAGRWICFPVALAAAWLYVRVSLEQRSAAAIAYFAAIFAGGFGFFFLNRPDTPLGRIIPLDVAGPTFTLLGSLQMAPHLALAIGGLAVYFWGLVQSAQGRRRGLWGAPALAFIASFHGFVVPMALVAGALFVATAGRRRDALINLALATTLCAPFLAYLAWLRLTDPSIQGWQAVETADLENPISILVCRALLLPFAALGGWRAIKLRKQPLVLATCWAVAALAFDLTPAFSSNALHRTLEGSSLPIGVLAADGLLLIAARWRLWLLALTSISPAVQLIAIGLVGAFDPASYLPTGDYLAMSWLREHGVAARVLVPAAETRWLAGLTLALPVADSQASADLDALAAAAPDQRSRLLAASGASYAIVPADSSEGLTVVSQHDRRALVER